MPPSDELAFSSHEPPIATHDPSPLPPQALPSLPPQSVARDFGLIPPRSMAVAHGHPVASRQELSGANVLESGGIREDELKLNSNGNSDDTTSTGFESADSHHSAEDARQDENSMLTYPAHTEGWAARARAQTDDDDKKEITSREARSRQLA